MQFRDLPYGFVIDFSFYPQTVVGEPERVAGRSTWRVQVYNKVFGTSWFEALPDDRMQACALPADFGPHPSAYEYATEQTRLAIIQRATEQRKHEERLAKWAEETRRAGVEVERMRNERMVREAEELARLLDPADAF